MNISQQIRPYRLSYSIIYFAPYDHILSFVNITTCIIIIYDRDY